MSTRDAVENAIINVLRESGEMVTRFVALVETIGEEGDRGIFTLASADMKAWDTIGMLGFGLQCEQARMVGALSEGGENAD